MQKFAKYFSILVVLLYYFLAVYILVGRQFQYLTREIKIIFAVFLFLYGSYRLARIWTKSREDKGE
jgi:hypothetical protein